MHIDDLFEGVDDSWMILDYGVDDPGIVVAWIDYDIDI